MTGRTWEVLYPRPQGPWSAVLSDAGRRAYGLYDPETGEIRQVAPADDRALPGLQWWLARGELIAYRVGRRAVVRTVVDGEVAYAKVVPPRKVPGVARRAVAAAAVRGLGPDGFPDLPGLLVADGDEGFLLVSAVAGRSLHELVAGPAPLDRETSALVARALARFHATPAAGLDLPAPPGVMGPGLWATLVGTQFPELEDCYRRALHLVTAAPPAPATGERLVHGDLHDKNVVVSYGRIGLLDLDGLRAGDPVEDVANLAAHLVLRALQRGEPAQAGRRDAARLTAAYRQAGGCFRGQWLLASGARALFRLACVYRFRRRWQGLTPALLAEAEAWAMQAGATGAGCEGQRRGEEVRHLAAAGR